MKKNKRYYDEIVNLYIAKKKLEKRILKINKAIIKKHKKLKTHLIKNILDT